MLVDDSVESDMLVMVPGNGKRVEGNAEMRQRVKRARWSRARSAPTARWSGQQNGSEVLQEVSSPLASSPEPPKISPFLVHRRAVASPRDGEMLVRASS